VNNLERGEALRLTKLARHASVVKHPLVNKIPTITYQADEQQLNEEDLTSDEPNEHKPLVE
jgi:hypothetical protein